MGEFIDFGEPQDKHWREDLSNLIRRIGINAIVTEKKDCDSPWEEFDHIKKALYSVRMANRYQTIKIKNDWVWERSKEINAIRNALYTQALRMIIFARS